MIRARKTAEQLRPVRGELFDMVRDGSSLWSIANRFDSTEVNVRVALNSYRPYVHWLRDNYHNRHERDAVVRMMRKARYSVEDMAIILQCDQAEMQRTVNEVRKRDNRAYFQAIEESNLSKVSIYDVENFRDAVNEGQMLCYGETEDGVLLYCMVERKYKYWCMTDQGSFEWNWLAVKNKEMFGK